MPTNKPVIKEVIIVEGKTDTAVLKTLYDVDTIETSGLALDEETLGLIKTASETRGVIVLTDPDYPGQKIRHRIEQAVPNAKHAFIKKKDAIGEKKLGVAEARTEAIIEAINNAVTFAPTQSSLSWSEFISLDIIGDKARRQKIYETFNLGHGNVKTLFKRLNMVGITYTQIKEALDE
ncbi:MAG: ribonuclease M5 [Erysipelotrichaceae bacterium]|nr:ribonuclease M5 [Erysipelotrichaceae bacterium]